ncbi:hypothetical protein BX666DRAFT_1937523 [Dichotomocladium elegans]|nr:hypothetical protein BX666DRAFT_1937523 [Dichotomocladium elegans]
MQPLNVALPNDWLQYLGKHRIFSLSAGELQAIQPVFNDADSNDTFAQQYQSRVMILRGSDLIVAAGSQIRILNLNDVKDSWIDVAPRLIDNHKDGLDDPSWLLDIPYKILSTPDIDFVIEALTLNESGDLLAVVGRGRLVVVCLPVTGFSHSIRCISKARIDCKTFVIGKSYLNDGAHVVKALWHPLSETQTHLMVLTTDSFLRMFDVSGNIDEAEQSFDLSPSQRRTSETSRRQSYAISLDDELDMDEEAVTFALGGKSEKESGWEPFTVYYALRNGHIYALCPVLPYKSAIRREHLETLACMVDAKTNRLLEERKSRDDNLELRALYYLLRLQSQWISDLVISSKEDRAVSSIDPTIVTVCSRDSHVPFPVQRQGPFMINGESVEFGSEVGDLVLIKTDTANILVTAYTNGYIQTLLLGSDIDPQWLMPMGEHKEWIKELREFVSSSDLLPKASVSENIQICDKPNYGTHRISLVRDPLYNDIIYVYHAGGAHRVSMKKLFDGLAELERSFDSNLTQYQAAEALNQWSKKDKRSEVSCLIDSDTMGKSIKESVIGFIVITDIYLAYSLMALTQSYTLVSHELDLDLETPMSSSAVQQSNITADTLPGNGATNDCLLTSPVFSASATQSTQTKVVVPPEMAGKKEVVITEESLRFLSRSAEVFSRNIKDVNKGIITAEKRLQLQEKELQRQIQILQQLNSRLNDKFSEDTQAAFREKIHETALKHGKLAVRLDSVLRRAMGQNQPGLSTQEKEWVQSLDDIKNRVDGDQGYLTRIKKVQEQLSTLSLKSNPMQIGSVSRMADTQLNALREALDRQSKRVASARERIASLEKTV